VAIFEIYKKTQGKYLRIGTFAAAMLIVIIGSKILRDKLSTLDNIFLQFGIPVAVTLVLAAVVFWLVNRPSSADFLISTEGEMKKVSWSSKKEVIGSTKVVIVTTVILSMMLLAVDMLFIWFFSNIGLM
jgi:preprotein translocase subunit SecE